MGGRPGRRSAEINGADGGCQAKWRRMPTCVLVRDVMLPRKRITPRINHLGRALPVSCGDCLTTLSGRLYKTRVARVRQLRREERRVAPWHGPEAAGRGVRPPPLWFGPATHTPFYGSPMTTQQTRW